MSKKIENDLKLCVFDDWKICPDIKTYKPSVQPKKMKIQNLFPESSENINSQQGLFKIIFAEFFNHLMISKLAKKHEKIIADNEAKKF